MKYFLFFVMIFCSGCASIVTTSLWPVNIQSTPSEASISITDRKGKEVYKGHTPAIVNLKASSGFFRRNRYQVTLSAEGFDSASVALKPSLNYWYFGNLLYGGIPGMLIIDPATGAMYKFKKKGIYQPLTKN